MRIHFLQRYRKESERKIIESFPNNKISFDLANCDLESIELLVGGSPPEDLIQKCINLRKLIIPYAGLPAKTKEILQKHPLIDVHNIHHNSLSVAENAITFLFSMAKDIFESHSLLKGGNWESRYRKNRSTFITGKNILMLGFGCIGRDVHNLLSGFKMNFYVYNRVSILPESVHKISTKKGLRCLLPEIDYVINSLPLTDDTLDFLGEKEFSVMKKTSCLVNVGRAKTINEEALYLALQNQHIKAAYFDVWYNYPTSENSRTNTCPTNFPFHELENFYFSPHRAGGLGIEELEDMRVAELIDYLKLHNKSQPVPHKIDLELGY